MKQYQYYQSCALLWGIWGSLLDDPLKTVAWIAGIACCIISFFSQK